MPTVISSTPNTPRVGQQPEPCAKIVIRGLQVPKSSEGNKTCITTINCWPRSDQPPRFTVCKVLFHSPEQLNIDCVARRLSGMPKSGRKAGAAGAAAARSAGAAQQQGGDPSGNNTAISRFFKRKFEGLHEVYTGTESRPADRAATIAAVGVRDRGIPITVIGGPTFKETKFVQAVEYGMCLLLAATGCTPPMDSLGIEWRDELLAGGSEQAQHCEWGVHPRPAFRGLHGRLCTPELSYKQQL